MYFGKGIARAWRVIFTPFWGLQRDRSTQIFQKSLIKQYTPYSEPLYDLEYIP